MSSEVKNSEEIRRGSDSQYLQGRKRKKTTAWAGILLGVVLWLGLVAGGFYVAKTYIDQSMQNIQQTNAMNIKAVNDRLDAIASDIQALKNGLNMTGQTLSSSGDIQRELSGRIVELESQLLELQKSLQVLKEAP